jgi:RHS repeat-associated protein
MRLLIVLLGAVFCLVLCPAGASAESLCTDTWTGPSEGSWETASNWSGGHIPGSSDVACIGSGKTVTAASGTHQAGVVQGEGTLAISGGSLEVSSVLEPSVIKNVSVSKGSEFGEGALTGAAEVEVTGSFTGGGYGTLSGSGSTVIEAGATGTITATGGAGLYLNGRTLRNAGTLTVGKGSGLQGSNSAVLANSGTLIVNGETGTENHGLIAFPKTATLVNTGTVKKTEGTGTTPIQFEIDNEGTISDTVGKLEFTAGGTSGAGTTGSWSASGAGTAILFTGYEQTWSLGAKVPVTGTFEVQTGTVTAGEIEGAAASVVVSSYATEEPGVLEVTGSTPSTLANLTVTKGSLYQAGKLAGTAEIDITSSFIGGGYAQLRGTGSTVIESGATGAITPTGGSGFTLAGWTLRNAGTLTIPKGSGLQGVEGAKLINTGTLIVNGETAADNHGLIASEKGAKLTNYGRMTKTEGTGKTPIQFEFENFGSDKPETGSFEILYPVAAAAPSTQYGGGAGPSTLGQNRAQAGCAVACATGNESDTETDLSVGGRGVGLDLARTYNSQAGAEGTKGAFGYGWTSSFSDHLLVEKAIQKATLVQANGSTVPFTEGTGGAYTAPSWSPDKLSGTPEAGYTLTLADQTRYQFAGSSGRLESVTDRNGNATALAYNEAGKLGAITDPTGTRKITLKYNGEGLVESAKDPMGHEAKYAYEAGNLTGVTEPGEASARWQFKYDGAHQMTTMTDGRGGKMTREYNAAHQVISETDPMERTLSFEYEPFHTRITNKATGSVTDEYFTSNYEPSSITRGYGTSSTSTESFAYNEAGYVTAVTDGNGHTTKYGYDGEGNRTSTLDANEHETKWSYNTTHAVISTTTPKGETTTIKRDSHGNAEVIERPAPGGKTQTTKYKYDVHGQLESVTDPLERVWKYEYTTQGDRTAETDPVGDKRTWAYDEDSHETSTVSPRGNVTGAEPLKFTTKIERDAQERPIKVTDPLVHETKYEYDANGNLKALTDANAHTTKYEYDADNEPTKVTKPNGATSETGYDGAGRVTSQTDGNKHITKYVRNPLGEITEAIDPKSRKTAKEYDAVGNLKALTDASKRTTSYVYDPANRLSEVSYSDGKTPAVKYEYDADGDRTTMVDGTGTSTYGYDQLDRLTETKDGHGDTSGYEYDLANQQIKITYPNGKAVARAYDKAGRLEKVTDWLANATKFAYDADADLTTATFPTGTGNVDKYTYNDADQLTKNETKKGTEVLASLAYTRDKLGQLKQTTQKGLPGEEKTAYTYDANDRVTKAGTAVYEYDGADNPTKTAGSVNTYDSADQLEKGISSATINYTYDELGERTSAAPLIGPSTAYGYDQAGNLAAVTRPKEGETPAIEDSYAYDGNGLRAAQTVAGSTSYLAWDAGASLPLLLADGTNSYVYGPGDVPIEQINNSTGTSLYLHHDQQGSTRLLTSSTGTKEATFTYDAYGNKTGTTGTTVTPLGYGGQFTSSDTGLIYLRARTYDAATAQFLSVDPRAAVTGAPYSYGADNPANSIDPSGLGAIAIPIEAPEAPACFTPETIGPCAILVGGGYVIAEGVKSIVNAWAGDESGNDEGEALLKQRQAEEAQQASELGCGSTPPGYDRETWTKGPASRPSDPGENLYDPQGGEWRWHAPDKYHPKGHWDYKGPGNSAKWDNIYP